MTLQIKQVFLDIISFRFYGYCRSICHHLSSIDHGASVLGGYWMTLWLIINILYSEYSCDFHLLSCRSLYNTSLSLYDHWILDLTTAAVHYEWFKLILFSSVRLEAGSCWENWSWKKCDWKHHTGKRLLQCRCQSLLR